jgi:biopolymer transport protein ExbD
MRRDHQSSGGGEEDDINMTPMLDIVFIMLIFFIVTASFVKEAGIDVNRPLASQSDPKRRASILVAVSPLNEVWIQKRRVEITSVRPIIERLRAENPQGSIVIQADEGSKSGTVLKVVDQIKAAGVTDISISTEIK